MVMTEKETIRRSKFLRLVLRHEPERIGLTLDTAGWVSVNELLQAAEEHGTRITLEELKHIVATSEKKRFAFSDDSMRIRANQGHSVEVELQYEPQTPPEILYHGTASRFLESIRQGGLSKMQRHHVHLSAEKVTTLEVGARRGRPVLLVIRARDMQRAGHTFYCSANQVWLVDHVPPQFINFPEEL
jgi:putative RNA 2'-phosphotransferase